MKKCIHFAIILMILIPTLTVSSSTKIINLEKTKIQNEKDFIYNDPFIEFLTTGLKNIYNLDEYDKQSIIKR